MGSDVPLPCGPASCDNGGMSKLGDRIRKAARVEQAAMGFMALARTQSPTMLCLVRVAGNDTKRAAEAVEKGADVIILDHADGGAVKEQGKKAGQAILGGRPERAERRDVAALREAGADFVVLDAQSAMAEALLEEKIGFVLEVESDADDTTLRLLGDLGLDALIVPPPDGSLTLQKLLGFRRLAMLSRTPLLTAVDSDWDAGRLQALRECGVAGVIVDASSIGNLQRLGETIASLPARGRRREERTDASLPAQVMAGVSDDDYDDDD